LDKIYCNNNNNNNAPGNEVPVGLKKNNNNNNNNFPLFDLQTQLHSYNIQQAVMQDKNGRAQTWSVCNKGITQFLPATHTQTIPFLYSQPQGIIALWLVLIVPTHEGMAKLS